MNYKKANYPIERIRLMDDYNAVDETAMRDNNTSSLTLDSSLTLQKYQSTV